MYLSFGRDTFQVQEIESSIKYIFKPGTIQVSFVPVVISRATATVIRIRSIVDVVAATILMLALPRLTPPLLAILLLLNFVFLFFNSAISISLSFDTFTVCVCFVGIFDQLSFVGVIYLFGTITGQSLYNITRYARPPKWPSSSSMSSALWLLCRIVSNQEHHRKGTTLGESTNVLSLMTDHNRCYCSTHTHGIEGGFGPLPPNDRYQNGDHCSHTTRHSFGCRWTIPGPMHAAVGTILRVSHRQSHSGSGVCNIFQRNGGY